MRKKNSPPRGVGGLRGLNMTMFKWFDTTYWLDDKHNEGLARDVLSRCCERFAYGREFAPTTGAPHLQIRGILRAPADADLLLTLSGLGFRNITPTHVKNFDYIYKSGDYYCSWEIDRPEFHLPKYPWQTELEGLSRNDRTVEIVWDSDGNSGKTLFGRMMQAEHKALYIPPVARSVDIASIVLSNPTYHWYILDLPRAFPLDQSDFWCGVEQLKNGFIYDVRYQFKSKDLGLCPRVTVMTNHLTKRTLAFLSQDRYSVYTLSWDSLNLDGKHLLLRYPDELVLDE